MNGEKRFSSWVLLFLIVGLPAACSNLSPQSDDIKKPLLAILTTIGLFFCIIESDELPSIPRHVSTVLLGSYLAICLLSFTRNPIFYCGVSSGWWLAILMGVFLIGVRSANFAVRSSLFSRSVILVGSAIGLYGLLQRAGLDPLEWRGIPRGRVHSLCGHPNILAACLLFSIPLTASVLVSVSKAWLRVLLCNALAIQASCLVFTFSRGGWIAGAISGALWIFLSLRNSSRRMVVGVSTLLVASIGLALVVGSNYEPFSSDPTKAARKSFETRRLIWKSTATMISHRPLLGWGLGTFNHYIPEFRGPDYIQSNASLNIGHAHSELLEVAAETGIVGGFVAVAFVISVLILGFKAIKYQESTDRFMLIGLLCAVTGILVQGAFDITLRSALPAFHLWLILGILTGLTISHRGEIALSHGVRYTVAILFSIVVSLLIYNMSVRPLMSKFVEREASDLKEIGIWNRASDLYRHAVEIDPWNLEARYERAICLVQMERFDEAIKTYGELERISPNYIQIHYNVGMIRAMQEKWVQAESEFRKADNVSSLPVDFPLSHALQIFRGLDDNHPKKIAFFESVVNARFRDEARLSATPLNALAPQMTALAMQYHKEGKLEQAEVLYRMALQNDPRQRSARNNIAAIYFLRKEYVKAIYEYEVLAGHCPNDIPVILNLAGALATKGDLIRAKKVLQELLTQTPQCQEANKLLIQIQEQP